MEQPGVGMAGGERDVTIQEIDYFIDAIISAAMVVVGITMVAAGVAGLVFLLPW
jgi:precorrin isomerase